MTPAGAGWLPDSALKPSGNLRFRRVPRHNQLLDAEGRGADSLSGMALPESKLLLLVDPPTAYFRVVGRAAIDRALDFKDSVRRLNAEGVSQFCIDFSRCHLLDSTFAGVIGSLAEELGNCQDGRSPRLAIWRPNKRVRDALENLDVLHLLRELPDNVEIKAADDSSEVAATTGNRPQLAQCCLDAHRWLSALNAQNAEKFREVTRTLGQQLASGPA